MELIYGFSASFLNAPRNEVHVQYGGLLQLTRALHTDFHTIMVL